MKNKHNKDFDYSLYHDSPCGFHSVDTNGFIIKINETLLQWLGYQEKDLIGQHVTKILNFSKEEFDKKFSQFKKVGLVKNIEVELKKADGSILYCLGNSKIIYDEAGNFKMTRAVLIDITKEVENWKKYKAESSNLSSLVEHSYDGIIGYDLQGKVISWNKKAELIFEKSAEYAIGKNLAEFIPDFKVKVNLNELNSFKATTRKTEIRKSNNQILYLEIIDSPVIDSESHLIGFSKIARDVTEEVLRKKEQELHQQLLISTSKLTSLGEMAANIAHEINNPLTVITHKSKVLLKELERNHLEIDRFKSDLLKMHETSQRISKVVDALKCFSRDSSHDEFELIEISKIINDSIELCRERFNSYSIELQISDFKDDLIECRPNQIVQVIYNLLMNSFQELESKNRDAWIRINVIEFSELIKIEISDSGSGIPNEISEKIMQPFFSTKGIGKSSGLGLSTSLGIINSHHGRLFLDSSSINTTFVIEIPKRQKILKAG
jgi:PAS domain S-box-containing protein